MTWLTQFCSHSLFPCAVRKQWLSAFRMSNDDKDLISMTHFSYELFMPRADLSHVNAFEYFLLTPGIIDDVARLINKSL